MHGIVTIGSSERDSERERERKGGRGRRTAALSLGRYLSTLGSVRRSLSIEPSKEAPFSCTACTHALTHKTHSRYTRGREQGRVCKGRHSLPLTKTGRPCVYIHSQHVAMTTHACPPSTHCSASPTPHHTTTTQRVSLHLHKQPAIYHKSTCQPSAHAGSNLHVPSIPYPASNPPPPDTEPQHGQLQASANSSCQPPLHGLSVCHAHPP